MKLRYYEDCEVGEEYISPSRTVTEADVVLYCGLSGDYMELHASEEYAKKTIYKTRVAHGILGLTIANGLELRTDIVRMAGVASLGWTWDCRKALKIGDTVFLKCKIARKRETKNPERGILFISWSLINQRDEVVHEGEHRLMVLRKK